jgi:hypothetical protein
VAIIKIAPKANQRRSRETEEDIRS